MSKFVFALGASLAIATVSTPAAADERQTVLEPSSRWHVDFAPNKCRLGRGFGDAENLHLLFLDQHYPSSQAAMTLSGPSFQRFKSRASTSLFYSSDQEPKDTKPFKGDLGKYGPALVFSAVSFKTETEGDEESESSSLSQLDIDSAAEAEFIAVTQGTRSVRLKTGSLADAFKVLNQCTQSLIEEWGLDVDKHMTAQTMPKWKNQKRIVRRIIQTYPKLALNLGEQGIFRIRVMINESGAVTDCVINEVTVADKLDSPACAEMKNAKFAPALDKEGKPFPSYFATSIVYRMSG